MSKKKGSDGELNFFNFRETTKVGSTQSTSQTEPSEEPVYKGNLQFQQQKLKSTPKGIPLKQNISTTSSNQYGLKNYVTKDFNNVGRPMQSAFDNYYNILIASPKTTGQQDFFHF